MFTINQLKAEVVPIVSSVGCVIQRDAGFARRPPDDVETQDENTRLQENPSSDANCDSYAH